MRELTMTVIVLDDDTCWIREAETMRQLPGLTGEVLGASDGGSVAVVAPRPKRQYTRRATTKPARVKKSRGGQGPCRRQ